jgi:CHAD domain-containing protein
MSTILDHLESQERHDLRGAVRVVRYAVEAILAGERFEGEDGPEQLDSLAEAVGTIERILGIGPPTG